MLIFLVMLFSWDALYSMEVKNFKDHGDIGEIWFGEESEDALVKWLNENIEHFTHKKVLDVGCGNGHLLLQLLSLGCKNLTGIDYSQQAIELAKAVVMKRRDAQQSVHLLHGDILEKSFVDQLRGEKTFDVVLDKGTFDAICLMDDGVKMKQKYNEHIKALMNMESVFLVTSCNWTRDELVHCFQRDMVCISSIKYPEFEFGGKRGSRISTVAFKLKDDLLRSVLKDK